MRGIDFPLIQHKRNLSRRVLFMPGSHAPSPFTGSKASYTCGLSNLKELAHALPLSSVPLSYPQCFIEWTPSMRFLSFSLSSTNGHGIIYYVATFPQRLKEFAYLKSPSFPQPIVPINHVSYRRFLLRPRGFTI